MMSTPAATRVESVREKRAIVILRIVSPILSGKWRRRRSQTGRLARLDHGDVEPAEDLRMPLHRLREQQTALDVFAKRSDHVDEVRVRRLLLEDEQRGNDVHARLDHRRELAREDLERLRLDA